MRHFTMFMFSLAMMVFTVVSMWTTYESLTDSILPGGIVNLQVTPAMAWQLALPALGLSVAIGMMLLGLKFAIIHERRKLGIPGFVGLFVIAFISIAFNLDVLYRTANEDFHLRYTDKQMRQTYEDYLAQVQHTLKERETAVLKQVAIQEAELESEIEGLRQAPAGFGTRAREEKYELNLLERESEVELASVREGLAAKDAADELLATTFPTTLDGIEELENEVRVLAKDAGAAANIPLPPPSKPETPLFAVFSNLFNPDQIGFEEVFFLLIAIMLDLGDIVGFNLVNRKGSLQTAATSAPATGYKPAEYIPDRLPIKSKAVRQLEADYRDDDYDDEVDDDYYDDEDLPEPDLAEEADQRDKPRKPKKGSGRPVRFRRGIG